MGNYKADGNCVVCGWGAEDQVCFHHIMGQGAHGKIDKKWNLLPVCQRCHNEIHDDGLKSVAEKNVWLEEWLLKNNWYLDKFLDKWIHESDPVDACIQKETDNSFITKKMNKRR